MTQKKFIGVICGLKSEAAAVSASVDQSKIRIGVSGANAARAEEIAKQFCDEGAAAILSVGVSGGLDPALKPGDLIIGETVIADDGSIYGADNYLMSIMREARPEHARFAPLFGADGIIDSAMKKSALFHNHGAVAVDMESHGAARAAAHAGRAVRRHPRHCRPRGSRFAESRAQRRRAGRLNACFQNIRGRIARPQTVS